MDFTHLKEQHVKLVCECGYFEKSIIYKEGSVVPHIENTFSAFEDKREIVLSFNMIVRHF